MIVHMPREQSNNGSLTDSRRLLLILDADPVLHDLVATVCERHQWPLAVAEDRCEALLPSDGQRPKFLLVGFSLDDENALQLLCDLHAMYPNAPVGLITADAPDDVADVVGLAGGTAVVVKSCDVTEVSALM